MLLGGQHIAKTLCEIEANLVAQYRPVPTPLGHVRAVLLHNTPLEVRLAAAGDHQFAQGEVTRLKLSQTVALLLPQSTMQSPELPDRMVRMLRLGGRRDRVKDKV